MRFDLNEVSSLLHIHEKATGHPKLKPLADAAMKHLEALADETAKPEAQPEQGSLVDSDPKGLDDDEPEIDEPAKDQPTAPVMRRL